MNDYMGPLYTFSASDNCRASGCQLQKAQTIFTQAQKALEQMERLAGRTREGKPLSQALWCDAGEHAFSARDPKSERWERQVKNDEGTTITIPWDVCGECLGGMGTPGFNMKERSAIMRGEMPASESGGSR